MHSPKIGMERARSCEADRSEDEKPLGRAPLKRKLSVDSTPAVGHLPKRQATKGVGRPRTSTPPAPPTPPYTARSGALHEIAFFNRAGHPEFAIETLTRMSSAGMVVDSSSLQATTDALFSLDDVAKQESGLAKLQNLRQKLRAYNRLGPGPSVATPYVATASAVMPALVKLDGRTEWTNFLKKIDEATTADSAFELLKGIALPGFGDSQKKLAIHAVAKCTIKAKHEARPDLVAAIDSLVSSRADYLTPLVANCVLRWEKTPKSTSAFSATSSTGLPARR